MMNVESRTEYVPGDPILIRDIISQLKSQGVFDQFRKECISDVDTKPAYQNLCHRVDGQVSSYLSDIRWGPDLNKNQLRENIRKYVNKCTFVEPGIARIVDQLVNPRINTVLVPKVEDIVYQYVGIAPVDRNVPNESSHDPNGNHIFDSHDSSFEKSRLQKRNHENEPSWLRSPSRRFDNYVHSKKDSSNNVSSFFDLKIESRDEVKIKNEDSRMDFFHSENGDNDDSRAYSTIDSDEDNLNDDDVEEPSPSFEAFGLPDPCHSSSSEYDFPAEVPGSESNLPPGMEVDEESTQLDEQNDKITNTDSADDPVPQIESKVIQEMAPTLDVPKTPTINYETSEDSDDNNASKKNEPLKDALLEQDHRSLPNDVPDFSSVDKIAQKIAEDNREPEKVASGEEEVIPKVGEDQKAIESTIKPSDEKTDRHKDGGSSKSAESSAKSSKHRDRKHSEHKKDKHKSDKRDSSRDDKEHKHREKERANHHDSSRSKSSKSRTGSREKTRKSSDEKDPVDEEASNKLKSKDEHKSHRSHDERKSRDKDEKKQKSSSSGDKRSKDDKSKEKRSRSGDGKEDRKKSRHDRDRSKDEKKSQEDEKVKLKNSTESKRSSKSQCGSDEKKARTDRRSSDRDSSGPSSSSNHSHHRSSSKSDKEKHSDKSRHSSLTSSSHKSKKSDDTKSVSSDRHPQEGCENLDTVKHKEHSHHEKKSCENSDPTKYKEHSHHEKKSCENPDTSKYKEHSHPEKKSCENSDTSKHKEHSHPEKKSSDTDTSKHKEHSHAEKKSSDIDTSKHKELSHLEKKSCENPDTSKPKEHSQLEKKSCENPDTSKPKEHSYPEKKSCETNSVKSEEKKSGENSDPAKPKDPSHPEKKKVHRSNSTPQNVDHKPKGSGASDTNPKKLDKKSTPKPSPAKRSLAEVNSKSVTSNELPSNSSLKTSESGHSLFNIKKPKIARNESEFGKVVRLRKEYKEKIKLLQQQGKENNGSCQEDEDKRIIERLSAATPKETKIVPNGNINGLITEIKLSITPIDACYQIVNGSCLIKESKDENQQTETPTAAETKKQEPAFDEKPFKIKIFRSISPTSGIERTKCVQSSYEKPNPVVCSKKEETNPCSLKEDKPNPGSLKEDKMNPCGLKEDKTNPCSLKDPDDDKKDCGFYPPSENDDDLEEEEDLFGKMNVEEIIGCRPDCTRISYDVGDKNVSEVSNLVKEQIIDDKNVILYDENNKENVGSETRCINDASANRVPRKASAEVYYFEPSSPNNDFIKFVEELIRKSEDICLSNFSIDLSYPREYDVVFQSQLGATVRRSVDPVPGNSSGAVVPSNVHRFPSQDDAEISYEILQIEHRSSCEPSAAFVGSESSKCDSSHGDKAVAPVQKVRIVNTTRRRTLGIKRKISSISGGTPDTSRDLSLVTSRLNPSFVACGDSAKNSPEVCSTSLAAEETVCLNTYTRELNDTSEIGVERFPLAVEEEANKRIYSSFNNNVPESSSYPVPAKTPKRQRKNSPFRPGEELLTEMVPKRTAYQNKCYYDSSDLYKPRLSFLASSRRSRASNPDSK